MHGSLQEIKNMQDSLRIEGLEVVLQQNLYAQLILCFDGLAIIVASAQESNRAAHRVPWVLRDDCVNLPAYQTILGERCAFVNDNRQVF